MDSFRDTVTAIRSLVKTGSFEAALSLLRSTAQVGLDFSAISSLSRLAGAIPVADRGRPLRIALLGSATLDQFAEALRLWLLVEGFAAEIWIAPFDTATATIFDAESDLYRFEPDIVWLFNTYRDVRLDIPLGDSDGVQMAVEQAVQARTALWTAIREKSSAAIIENNADIPAHDQMGNFAGQVSWSVRNALRRYNLAVADAAPSGVTIFDLDHVSATLGKSDWIDLRYWYHSKHPASFDAQARIAFMGSRVIATIKGLAKKCLVLDLDNTLWGGVIGDDGIDGIKLGFDADGEAFTAMQQWARQLKDRGIILAVCSKNEDVIARAAFQDHPEMVLKIEDITVFRANWENKADNIRYIADTLNIGLDAMVFVDDNPVERNLVRHHLPMVAVPELPVDPTGYIPAIELMAYFETVAFAIEDKDRHRFYADNAKRAEMMGAYSNQSEYLQTLDQVAEVGDLDAVNLPRMAQLVNKSNQFNLTTLRYSDADLAAIAREAGSHVRFYRLADKFGDNGLISVVALKGKGDALDIDLWVMSCRVLARTMEEFILNDIVAVARAGGYAAVTGRYSPTAKNRMVDRLYQRLGFEPDGEDGAATLWRLDITRQDVALTSYVSRG